MNHHAKESLHGLCSGDAAAKGGTAGQVAHAERGRKADLGVLALPRATDCPSRSAQGTAMATTGDRFGTWFDRSDRPIHGNA